MSLPSRSTSKLLRPSQTNFRIAKTIFWLLVALISPHAHSGTSDAPDSIIGTWGKIEYYEVTVEPPTSVLWESLFDERSYWSFGGLAQDEVIPLLKELGFAPDLIEKVSKNGIWVESETGTEVDIDDKIVESLTTANRTALTAWMRARPDRAIAKQLMNLELHDEAALRQRLKPSTVALLQSVTFLRESVVSIVDLPYLMRQLGSDKEEKMALIQTLFSTRSLVARLVIDESTDIDALAEYWSAGGRTPGIRSLLEGVRAAPGVDRIDLIHLLPPFPRKYNCSFINLDDVNPAGVPDCFWTSLLFFKPHSSLRFLDDLSIDHYLDFDFDEVEGPAQFGDTVVMFDKSDGRFIHSYVQIAGDIVFTKNGRSFAHPLILTTRNSMMGVYKEGYDFETEIYRRKPNT